MDRRYTNRCRTAWTGDAFGHEWKLGWTVHFVELGGTFDLSHDLPWHIYTDDGRGNGDWVCACGTERDAIHIVDSLVVACDVQVNSVLPAHGLLARALPMLVQLGDYIGNGPVDETRPDSLGARCDLIGDIKDMLEVA